MTLMPGECSGAASRRLTASARWRWFLVPVLSIAGLAMIPWLAALGWFLPRRLLLPRPARFAA